MTETITLKIRSYIHVILKQLIFAIITNYLCVMLQQ